MIRTPRLTAPTRAEVDASYDPYVAAAAATDVWPVLCAQPDELERLLGRLSEERARTSYAPGKWSVKQVIGHVCDNERVYAYRMLCFARGDPTPLPNFDENLYAATGGFDARPLPDLLDELRTVRASTLALVRTLDEPALSRTGVARGLRLSVRALCWITAGHWAHHVGVLRQRYGIAP